MPFKNEYRNLWKEAGYKTSVGSAAVRPPPHPDYLPLYHVTSADFGISNIALGRIKVARFAELNDPFELTAASFKLEHVRKAILEFKKDLNSKTGLLCFSADWINPVLWGHYGAKHTGICLGFDVKRDQIKKVEYIKERIDTKFASGAPPTMQDAEQLLYSKFHHWQYEEEYRLLVSLANAIAEGSLYFVPFEPELRLSEVILGAQCNISLADVQKLTKLLHPQAVTYKSRLADKYFNIVPDEASVP